MARLSDRGSTPLRSILSYACVAGVRPTRDAPGEARDSNRVVLLNVMRRQEIFLLLFYCLQLTNPLIFVILPI